MWTRRACLAAAALVLMTGCGPAVADPVPPAAVAGPVADPVLALQAVMLTPADVGPGFVAAQFRPSGPEETFTCGQPGIAARYTSRQVGAAMGFGDELLLIESVHVFADVRTAQRAYADVGEGFGCGAGTTVDGTPARIGPARNLTAEVGGDQAQSWTIDAQGTRVEVVSVQAEEAVVTFSLVATPDADAATVPDPADVARRGMTKLLAA